MKRFLQSFLFFTSFCSAQINLDSAVQEYIHNELLFSHTSVVKGRNTAFLEFLSDSCVMFNPLPVNGKDLFRSRTDREGYLTWKPAFVEISSSGDFCYAYGPWEFRKQQLSDEPIAYGHFFSVWEKENGAWKVTLDNGISYDKKHLQKEELQIVKPDRSVSAIIPSESERQSLIDAENYFDAVASKQTAANAYKKFSSHNIRLLREGSFPISIQSEVGKIIAKEHVQVKIHPFSARISSSGDLGLVYGTAVTSDKDSSIFVRVWRKEDEWKIAIDILQPFK